MSDTIIKVENLSKRYALGAQRAEKERYTALRDVMVREARTLGRKTLDLVQGRWEREARAQEGEFWALKDISFEVKRGEVLGIIGRNGAGKSTLLKILSRITEPTEGRVELHGRVASLLEVGTGFHPELTGRENIFLNGAILGMTKAEIRKKFDEIVDFAEVERFLDTPVKRYSSGMYVRLAFSVAAHLEPDILIVDEVLAVGDIDFQNKCLGRMDDISRKQNRTIIYVTHDLPTIIRLANRGLLLKQGLMVDYGNAADIVSSYMSGGSSNTVYQISGKLETQYPHVSYMSIETSYRNGSHEALMPLEITVEICHSEPLSRPCFQIYIVDQYQSDVVRLEAYYPDVCFGNWPGKSRLTCRINSLRLNVGRYYMRTHLTPPQGAGLAYEIIEKACNFEVVRTDKEIHWGWKPENCKYFEDFEWRVEDAQPQGKAISDYK